MTTTTISIEAPALVPAASRPRIMSPALALVFLASFGSLTSFYLLLSVVPVYATSVGAGVTGAGFATGALMLSTVAAELASPRLIARFGYRPVLVTGLVLLGAPALAFPLSSSMTAILVVCAVRGLGFAIIMVVGGALIASLVPAERRGEGLGLYGVVAGVPSIAALPLGVWLAGRVGYPAVFVAGAVTALAGLAAVPGLRGHEPAADAGDGAERPIGVLAGLATPALLRPSLVFAATTVAGGVVVTFLPLAVTHASGGLVAIALLVQSAAATLTRWWAGRYGDRRGPAGLLAPAVLVAGTGMLLLAVTGSPVAVFTGMLLFGAGFGVAQNASLSVMLARVPTSGYGTVSAVWNLAYDAGYGVGAAGFGVVAAYTGQPAGFAITGLLVLAALRVARRDHRTTR
ncbi:MAG TPA: MFS transporter [Micromonosporaceae bacterium]